MISIGVSQVVARCTKVREPLPGSIIEALCFPFSYEAALYIWDKARWKGNFIIIKAPPKLDWLIFDVRAPRLGVIEQQGKGRLLVEQGEDRDMFFMNRNFLVDPYLLYFKGGMNLLVDVLDDAINRLEPLIVHDPRHFIWEGEKFKFIRKPPPEEETNAEV